MYQVENRKVMKSQPLDKKWFLTCTCTIPQTLILVFSPVVPRCPLKPPIFPNVLGYKGTCPSGDNIFGLLSLKTSMSPRGTTASPGDLEGHYCRLVQQLHTSLRT